MSELNREAIIVLCVMVGIMLTYIIFAITHFIVLDIKEKKKKPKIEDLQRQLEYEKASYRNLREGWELSYKEHKALALAVKLIKCCDLNLNQLEELGLQRYNALQERGNFITNNDYEELVENHIIIQGERYERRKENK